MYNIFRVRGKIKFLPLVIFSILPLLCGLFVLYLNKNVIFVYNELDKPIFAMPLIFFISFWLILDVIMGVAAYRVYMIRNLCIDIYDSLFYYIIQIILNLLWLFIFFTFRLYAVAFLEAKIMLILLIITVVKFIRVDRIAAVLLFLQVLWIMYISVFNFFIWVANEM